VSYIVLARKWRPQTFADLTGQEHVAQTLTHAIERGRVPHALLFAGARGVGKTSSARILAMALNCAEGPTATPCGVCDSCVEVQRGQSVDILEIDGASNRGINEIRELRDGVRYAPHRDRSKVYIIDEVHMLTTEAFNALLKTLEEPPSHVVFIFATTEAHKIPVTILSRCQRFDFRRIPHADIVQRLTTITDAEGIRVDRDVLALIARQAAGGMRDALSLLDQIIAFAGTDISMAMASGVLGAAERERVFDLSDAIIDRSVDDALKVVDQVSSFGVDLTHFSTELVEHLRDLTVVSVSRDARNLTQLTDAELERARRQVQRTDPATLHRCFELMVAATEELARSAHARLVFEMTLVKLTALEPAWRVADLIDRLSAVASGASMPPPKALPPSAEPTTTDETPQPATTADAPAPVETVEAPEAAGSIEAPEAAESVDAPEAAESVDAPEAAESVDAPEAAESVDAPEAAESVDAPEATESVDAPEAAESVDAPEAAESVDAPEAAESVDAPEAAESVDAPEAITGAEENATQPPSLSTDDPENAETVRDPEPVRDAELETPESEIGRKTESATTAAVDPELTPVDAVKWREIVAGLPDDEDYLQGLLSLARIDPSSTTAHVRLALPDTFVSRWREDLQATTVALIRRHTGRDAALTIVSESEAPSTEPAAIASIVALESFERDKRQLEIDTFVAAHPVTARIRAQWPGATIRRTTPIIDSSESEEEHS